MKAIAQTFLIGVGVLGLLFAIPDAFYAWSEHRDSGVNFTAQQIGRLGGPLMCVAAIAIGVVWQKWIRKRESRPRVLTEDGTCADGGGDGGSD